MKDAGDRGRVCSVGEAGDVFAVLALVRGEGEGEGVEAGPGTVWTGLWSCMRVSFLSICDRSMLVKRRRDRAGVGLCFWWKCLMQLSAWSTVTILEKTNGSHQAAVSDCRSLIRRIDFLYRIQICMLLKLFMRSSGIFHVLINGNRCGKNTKSSLSWSL